jgi:epoxyqueuosine reductase
MIQKNEVIEKAYECGFGDIGFTTIEPFESQKALLLERQKSYAWVSRLGLDLIAGTDPKQIFPSAKTIIVLMEVYFKESFPQSMEKYFGRCYLDDDRMAKDRLAQRVKAFRTFLRDNGIDSKVPFNLPHRLAAARAGMGDFGKNCLFYSNKVVRQGSWVLPIAVVVDHEFSPGHPTLEVGCPDWCRNACIVSCPTGALSGPRKIDPTRCISYLTYFGEGITPMDLREPMGLWVYGCDHCQNVCPRNAPWLAKELPLNQKVAGMVDDFRLKNLLQMDKAYYNSRIWPHMFYMPDMDIWRWKMNVARAMGNSRDPEYLSELLEAFRCNEDERVLGMLAWAMGRIGGLKAKKILNDFRSVCDGLVQEEIGLALDKI